MQNFYYKYEYHAPSRFLILLLKRMQVLYGLDMEAKRRIINKINFYIVLQATKVIYVSLYVKRVSTLNTESINPCVMSTWV